MEPCLLGLQGQWGGWALTPGTAECPTTASLYSLPVSLLITISATGALSTFFRQLWGRSQFLPESLASIGSSLKTFAQETFWGGGCFSLRRRQMGGSPAVKPTPLCP